MSSLRLVIAQVVTQSFPWRLRSAWCAPLSFSLPSAGRSSLPHYLPIDYIYRRQRQIGDSHLNGKDFSCSCCTTRMQEEAIEDPFLSFLPSLFFQKREDKRHTRLIVCDGNGKLTGNCCKRTKGSFCFFFFFFFEDDSREEAIGRLIEAIRDKKCAQMCSTLLTDFWVAQILLSIIFFWSSASPQPPVELFFSVYNFQQPVGSFFFFFFWAVWCTPQHLAYLLTSLLCFFILLFLLSFSRFSSFFYMSVYCLSRQLARQLPATDCYHGGGGSCSVIALTVCVLFCTG